MKTNYVILSAFVMLLMSTLYTNAQEEINPHESKVLVVTHMQDSYYKGELTREATQDEIEKINQLIKSTNPDYVIYSKAMHKILHLTFKKIFVEESIKDLDDRLDVINENIFVDHGGDIFSSNELVEYLNNIGAKQIIIVGRAAGQCINTSTLSGLELGYDMYLIPDAIVGKSSKYKAKSLQKLIDKGAKELAIN